MRITVRNSYSSLIISCIYSLLSSCIHRAPIYNATALGNYKWRTCTNVTVNEKGVAQSLLHVIHVNHVFEDARSSRPTLRATRPTFPLVKVSKRYCFWIIIRMFTSGRVCVLLIDVSYNYIYSIDTVYNIEAVHKVCHTSGEWRVRESMRRGGDWRSYVIFYINILIFFIVNEIHVSNI